MHKFVLLFIVVFAQNVFAQTLAPGGPGKDAQWGTAAKQGIGTSATLESKVWFTLADGVMTEVYYPDVTTANVHMLQFVVVDPKTKKVETERDNATHTFDFRDDLLSFSQTSWGKNHAWTIVKSYTIDPEQNTVVINVNFGQSIFSFDPKTKRDGAADTDRELYVYFDPSLANSGIHDTGWLEDGMLLASDGNISSALIAEDGFEGATNGFLGVNDGLTQLRQTGSITTFSRAENGNLVQVAKLAGSTSIAVQGFQVHQFRQIVLGFGKNPTEAIAAARASLGKGFNNCRKEYEEGWTDYVKTLPKVNFKYQYQFNMAAMVLKTLEDKTVRGANVASLSIPWGGGKNANEDVGGGYHLVWARDLYEVFTAYMALGDKAAANRALDFLFNIQQKPDGSFPQNSWLDGKRGWGGLQMDEVGYPLIMAWQLGRFDKQTYEKHVKPAADFIVKNGPATPQERWEEKGGYSPSTIAAEIAGLVCAADIAKRNGDATSAALYLKTADDWQANVEKWTATTTGPYGDGHYYLRLTQGHPDAGQPIELNNGAGTFKENEIVDAGFLELVRLGVKSPVDPLIAKSVKVIDKQIKVDTPNGEGFYRYSHDGYGEMDDGRKWNWDGRYTGKGRLWALLSGERGQYELAQYTNAKSKEFNPPTGKSNYKAELQHSGILLSHVQLRLDAMLGFANEGLMIPEQVWDKKETPANRDREFVPELKFGEGTGSATPLAWSMAQFIRLAMNLNAGRNLDTPQIVYDRYVKGDRSDPANAELDEIPDSFKKGFSARCFAQAPLYLKDCSYTSVFVKELIKNPIVIKCRLDGFYLGCKDNANEMHACFAYNRDFKTLEIAGDFTDWKPVGISIKRTPDGTWADCFNFAKTARVEYKLIVDGKLITDPLNPNKVDRGASGENSFFTMPEYKAR